MTAYALTTGQIARYLDCAPRTVACWIDRGDLKGYRLPGTRPVGRDRRVHRDELVRFLEENGMPVPEELVPSRAFLCVGPNASDVAAELARLGLAADAEADLFGAGMALSRTRYEAVLLDGALGISACRTAAARLRLLGTPPLTLFAAREDQGDDSIGERLDGSAPAQALAAEAAGRLRARRGKEGRR